MFDGGPGRATWIGVVLGLAGPALMLTQCERMSRATSPARETPPAMLERMGPRVPLEIEDSLDTPPHSLSRQDYPFDAEGNYREDWVRREGGSGRSPSWFARRSSRAGDSSSRDSGGRRHVVRRGDTLYGLSRRYGVSVNSLRRANGLKGDLIRRGQVLVIPRG